MPRASIASKNSRFVPNILPDAAYVDSSVARTPSRAVIAAMVLVVVLLWSFNFIAAKITVRHLSSAAMASFRVLLGGIVMLPVYFSCSRFAAFADARKTRQRGFSLGDLWTFLYLGFFGVIVNQMCFTIGVAHTSVSHAAVIVGMGPIYTLGLAVLFRVERATWRKVTGMAIALTGVAVLASENGMSLHSSSLFGDAVAITGAIGFATYTVLGRQVAGKYDALTMITFNHIVGATLVLPFAIHEIRVLQLLTMWRSIPWPSWAALLYMAIFSSAVAYLLYFWLLRYLEASQLSAFTYLLPVTATILGILWLGERGSPMQVLGGALALAGVYWVESGRRR
jgi:drug/metabolite transporter (DMT)-like permease